MSDYNIDNAKNDIQNLQDQNKYDFQEIKRLDDLIKDYEKRVLQSINLNNLINKKIESDYSKIKKIILDELDKISNGNNISQLNFPQLNWIGVTLTSPIENVGSSFTPLRYSKDINGKVRIEGTIKGLTSGTINTLFTLPIGYRPKYNMFYDIVNYEGSNLQIGKLLVNRNGNVTIEGTLNKVRTDICVEFYGEQ